MARDLIRRPASYCLYKRHATWVPPGATLDDSLTEAPNPLSLHTRSTTRSEPRAPKGPHTTTGTPKRRGGPTTPRSGPALGVWLARLGSPGALAAAALGFALVLGGP